MVLLTARRQSNGQLRHSGGAQEWALTASQRTVCPLSAEGDERAEIAGAGASAEDDEHAESAGAGASAEDDEGAESAGAGASAEDDEHAEIAARSRSERSR